MTGLLADTSIVAVVPIRSLRSGKTRLATVLDLEEREALLRQSAERVVGAARHSGAIESVLVVSPEAATLDWAATLGPEVIPVQQPEVSPGLNGAIDAGRDWAIGAGASAMLSLFADLPFLSAGDILGMVGRREPLVLGPDRRGEGTNALLLRLAGKAVAFRFAFGEGSLARHQAEAQRLGLKFGIYRATGVAFDLDTPGDWTDFVAAIGDRPMAADSLLTPRGACIA